MEKETAIFKYGMMSSKNQNSQGFFFASPQYPYTPLKWYILTEKLDLPDKLVLRRRSKCSPDGKRSYLR